jgi:transposase
VSANEPQPEETLREEVSRLRHENEGLRKELEKLRREIEEWRRGLRERGKRRTSRSESKVRPEPKTPGRKAGHRGARRTEPTVVDNERAHPMPDCCPGCGGDVEDTGEATSTLEVDVPPVKPVVTRHTTPLGRCRQCHKRVVTRIPGLSPNGTTVAPVTLGPNLQAMTLSMRFDLKASLRPMGSFLQRWLGVSVSAGGLTQMFDRLRARSGAAYQEIETHFRRSPIVGMDETTLRQNGALGWCWLGRTEKLSLFRVELSRGRWVAERMLGKDFAGVVVSDFYAVYAGQGTWVSAYCGAHVIREAKKIAEVNPTAETESFRDGLRAFYAAGEVASTSGDRYARRGARARLLNLLKPTFAIDDVTRLQTRLGKHYQGVTRFIDRPEIPWNNNASERDLRCIARFRAATGGTRSERGSANVAHWFSVTQTLRKNGGDLGPFVLGLHEARIQGRAPPSLFER